MSSSRFKVIEHVLPCQHVREYPNATRTSAPRALKLAIKQYVPLKSPEPESNAVTVIAAHANGFPKECYEPLWDDLEDLSSQHGFRIRGIWAADCSQQGMSGVLNEKVQGDDTSWFDHSRDLLVMINHFADQMPRPIIGYAHSMGCAQLVNLSIFHPRLFAGLILTEPVILTIHPLKVNSAKMSTFRKDLWPSRAAAEAEFKKIKAFQAWDIRVLNQYLAFGLRQVPTALYGQNGTAPQEAVTLTTTKHQESWSYVRPNFEPQSEDMNRLLSPDLSPNIEGQQSSHRPEAIATLAQLPFLRPNVLYIFGGRSPMSTEPKRMDKLLKTGTGVGGNGGSKSGRVQSVVFEQNSHLVPFEATFECSVSAAKWLAHCLKEYKSDEAFHASYESKKSCRNMLVMSQEWQELVKKSPWTLRPSKEKL